VVNSISAAGFSDNVHDWHIARHDVYGHKFMDAWDSAEENQVNADDDEFNMDELHDCLDEISLLLE
jgi:valyl-tRNA synthetase